MYYKYPLSATNGDITLHDREDVAIADAITSALLTQNGERILRPDYGLPDSYFQALSPTLTKTINEALETGLEGFDVAYNLETSITEDGAVNAHITYDNRSVSIIL